MDWRIEDLEELHVTVDESWLESCQARMPDEPVLARLDPYCDTVLGSDDLRALRRALADLRESARATMKEEIRHRARLPKDPEVRATILAKLVDDGLATDPFHHKAEELSALIDMAIEQGCCVRVLGD